MPPLVDGFVIWDVDPPVALGRNDSLCTFRAETVSQMIGIKCRD